MTIRNLAGRGILCAACALLLLSVPALAAEGDIATLRVESLDALRADVERVAGAMNLPVQRDKMLAPLFEPLGIAEPEWLDGSRQVILVFPMLGMTLGPLAMVGAVPVADVDAALNGLEASFDEHSVDGELHTFSKEKGIQLVVQPRERYLIVGANPDLVRGFDLASAVAESGTPPGVLSIDVNLEPIAPVLRMGLDQGRQAIRQQVEEEAEEECCEEEAEESSQEESGAETGGDPEPEADAQAAPEDEGSTGEAEEEEAAAAAKPDLAAVSGILDLYFDVLGDALNNVSRIQLSAEVTSEHVILHERLYPMADSTFAELVAGQSAGFPDLARLIEPDDAIAVYTGRMTITPRFGDALKGYVARYLESLDGVMAMMEDEQPFLPPSFGSVMKSMEPLVGEWLNCVRGDFAVSFDLDPEAGMSIVQVAGAKDPEVCRSLIDRTTEIYLSMPPGPDGESIFTVTPDALTHAGVSAQRQEFRMQLPETAESEEAAKMLRMIFGEDGIVTYQALDGDLMFSTTGGASESEFKKLVDRMRKKKKRSGGITPELFAPLAVGAGLSGRLDMGALFRSVAGIVPEGEGEALDKLAGIPPEAGRFVYAARFEAGTLNADLALPVAFFSAVAGLEKPSPEGHEGAAEQRGEGEISAQPTE